MTTREEYLALITTEHQDRPKFEATVGLSVEGYSRTQDVLRSLLAEFDIETAAGVQLDTIGKWVGASRHIETPLVGVYFSWGDTADNGWGSGVWKNIFDPDSGLVDLPDDAYRTLLKAKIAANRWDGTIPQAYAIWTTAFGGEHALLIQDNQDMTMVIGVAGSPLSIVEQEMLINGLIPLKPEGVAVAYYAVVPAEGPLMAWGVQNGSLAGWGTGQWAKRLIPV